MNNLQQLEALRDRLKNEYWNDVEGMIPREVADDYSEELTTIIQQMKSEAVEPCGWLWEGNTNIGNDEVFSAEKTHVHTVPVYTTPPNTIPAEQVQGLVEALEDAAQSLLTITFAKEGALCGLHDLSDVRQFASGRSRVAKEELAKFKGQEK